VIKGRGRGPAEAPRKTETSVMSPACICRKLQPSLHWVQIRGGVHSPLIFGASFKSMQNACTRPQKQCKLGGRCPGGVCCRGGVRALTAPATVDTCATNPSLNAGAYAGPPSGNGVVANERSSEPMWRPATWYRRAGGTSPTSPVPRDADTAATTCVACVRVRCGNTHTATKAASRHAECAAP
jgi:hypothetical protein